MQGVSLTLTLWNINIMKRGFRQRSQARNSSHQLCQLQGPADAARTETFESRREHAQVDRRVHRCIANAGLVLYS